MPASSPKHGSSPKVTAARKQASEMVSVARSISQRVQDSFAAVTLEEYKDINKGPTYYDTVDEVCAAVQQAEDEAKRFDTARERTQNLVTVYNTFVPWVLRICNKRIDEVEGTLRSLPARGAAAEAKASAAEEQLRTIVQTVQCLAANVQEASTFLGKMGKTKEGAHDARVVDLASDSVSDGLTARHTKARRTKGIMSSNQRTHSGSEIEALESTPSDAVFFQKQRGAFCGVCAMNNMLGRRAVSYRESELLADSIWLRSVLADGCGVHFPASRLHSRRREFPFDGFIDFLTMNKLCQMHGVKLGELNRTKPAEVVKVIKDGLAQAGKTGRTRSRTGNALPLLFILLGSQKHYICLCARRTGRKAGASPVEIDADWDDICRLCGRAGELVCCDGEGCPRAYHPRCVGLAEDVSESDEAWLCPDCKQRDLSGYSDFEHETELLWMDSQLDRPVSERMLAVDRRTAGRNASLFHRFVTAARDCTDDVIDPLDTDNEETQEAKKGGKTKKDAIDVDGEEQEVAAGGTRRGGKAAAAPDAVAKRKPASSRRSRQAASVVPRVSERQIMERLEEKNWRAEGHELIGQRVRRYLGGERVANGQIVEWLPAGRDPEQMPLLFRIQHDKTRSKEDVCEAEARESVDAAIALGMVGGKRGRSTRGGNAVESPLPSTRASRATGAGPPQSPDLALEPAPTSRGGSNGRGGRRSKPRSNSKDSAAEHEAAAGDGGAAGRGLGTPVSSDALEELRRALDPASSEQIVAFAVEVESHHTTGTGKGGAAAVGGGVLQELQAADGLAGGGSGGGAGGRNGGTSDWHRCVDGLQRSGVAVGDSEARTWLQHANR